MRYLVTFLLLLFVWVPSPVVSNGESDAINETISSDPTRIIDDTVSDIIEEVEQIVELLQVPAVPELPVPDLPVQPLLPATPSPTPTTMPPEPQNAPSEAPVVPESTRVPKQQESPLETLPEPPRVVVVPEDGEPEPKPEPEDELDFLEDDTLPLWVTIIFAIVAIGSMIYATSERRLRKRLDKRLRKGLD